jgi:hypothetical protein
MSLPNKNWYSHLVAQSRTNDIYNLIHMCLVPDWRQDHDLDFVVVHKNDLPEGLKNIPANHISKKLKPEQYCFPGHDFVLLHNYQLTEYLYAAKWAKIIEDFEEREFILLCYQWTDEAEYIRSHPPAYPFSHHFAPPVPAGSPLPVTSEDYPLFMAYELLQSGTSRAQALEFAEQGKAFLDSQHITVSQDAGDSWQHLTRQMKGYNIVAMVYAWNDQINKAAAVDELYIHHPSIWQPLADWIKPYLEMLLVKKQEDYLQYLFADVQFRNYFLGHYEAFVSLFINEACELTCMGEVVGIINRVNNTSTNYL